MIKKQRSTGKNGSRAGMTIIELSLVIVVATVLIAMAIAGYKKVYIPMKGDAAFSQISSVIDSLERVRNSNGGVYPVAAAAKISATAVIENELGGATNSQDVADWTYDCADGSDQTITVVTNSFSDPTVAAIAASKTSSAKTPWVATVAGSVVTFTLANVVCH